MVSVTLYTIHKPVLLHLTSPSYLIVTLVFVSDCKLYVYIKKIYRKRYTWLPATCTAYKTCKTPQYTNIILRRNQFYYLLKDAAVKGCLCEGLSLNIYLCSLLCRAVDQWLCSVSVLHSEIFNGWRCYQQTVQKLICLSDLKWCCFSKFLSSYSYVLFRCVNRHYPLS